VVEAVVVELEAAGLELPQPAAATPRIVAITITDRHRTFVNNTLPPPVCSSFPDELHRQAAVQSRSTISSTTVKAAVVLLAGPGRIAHLLF
jgi:hypothetical protein